MDAKKQASQREHVYAIVRLDEFLGLEVPLERKITVKKVVWTEEEATGEVDRLNRLQNGKGCTYFYQITRLEREPALEPGVEVLEISKAVG